MLQPPPVQNQFRSWHYGKLRARCLLSLVNIMHNFFRTPLRTPAITEHYLLPSQSQIFFCYQPFKVHVPILRQYNAYVFRHRDVSTSTLIQKNFVTWEKLETWHKCSQARLSTTAFHDAWKTILRIDIFRFSNNNFVIFLFQITTLWHFFSNISEITIF